MHPAFDRTAAFLRPLGGALVAFSGGVDSSLLLAAAAHALGDRVLAVIAHSPLHPVAETESARAIAAGLRVRYLVIESDELRDAAFAANTERRCYHCKHRLFSRLRQIARDENLPVVVEGSNVDDLDDFRPGMHALAELDIVSPFIQLGIGKAEIRAAAREAGLPVWNRPATACLVSRLPYGEPISIARLARVERAEALLHEAGFAQARARDHGNLVRLEVPPDDIARLAAPALRDALAAALRELGYDYVALDLQGYRRGAMNETLTPRNRNDD